MKQKDALNILKAGRNVYLTGPAGSGKTYVLRAYIEYLKDRNVAVGLTASTGIAATHFGGVTIHSWSGMGIRDFLTERDIEELVQKEYLWKRFDQTKVLIIDEVSMLSPSMFDALESLARAMKRNEDPFGGMQVVLSGDFFQLPPIVKGGGTGIQFIDVSDAWRSMDVRVCYLSEQYRQKDVVFSSVLEEMRLGRVSKKSRDLLQDQGDKDEKGGVQPTRLYTHNVDVDTFNKDELDKLPGNARKYEMRTKGKAGLVNSLKKGVLAPEILELKKNALVMFVKNNFEGGYVNGTLGIVEDFEENVPRVRTYDGELISVYPAQWAVEEGGKVLAEVEQLPLRLAWAITVHKSQGMSLDTAEIDLSKSFVAGQGYVALSRLRGLEGLVLKGLNEMALVMNTNVLHRDKELQRESLKWERVIERFSDDEMDAMYISFIERIGGLTDEKEIEKNKKKNEDKNKDKKNRGDKKLSTQEKTKVLIEKGLGLKEIAHERGMTVGTILSHFEKLHELYPELNLDVYKPKANHLKKIKEAFAKSKDNKLAPIYKKLKGKYTYEELRLARIFL